MRPRSNSVGGLTGVGSQSHCVPGLCFLRWAAASGVVLLRMVGLLTASHCSPQATLKQRGWNLGRLEPATHPFLSELSPLQESPPSSLIDQSLHPMEGGSNLIGFIMGAPLAPRH